MVGRVGYFLFLDLGFPAVSYRTISVTPLQNSSLSIYIFACVMCGVGTQN